MTARAQKPTVFPKSLRRVKGRISATRRKEKLAQNNEICFRKHDSRERAFSTFFLKGEKV